MKKLCASLLIASFLFSCSDSNNDPTPLDPINATNIEFSVDYYAAFDDTVYPSMILGLRESVKDFNFFTMHATNSGDSPRTLKISIAANSLIETTTITKTLQAGVNSIEFDPNWDFESMKLLDQPGSVNFAYTISIDGEELTTYNTTIAYRSISECVFGFKDGDEFFDLKFMFAAYVNEDNPKIDDLLAEAKAYGIVDSYKGYQGTSDDVLAEVFSIWYYLQKNNTQYSNITTTSNSSSTVFSQNVRFFSQVLDNSSANCVDGSVFLSSILLKLGIEPVLILVPGHMYMGFYTAPNKQGLTLLETTLVGNVNINNILDSNDLESFAENGYFTNEQIDYYNTSCNNGSCDVEYMRKLISHYEFINAVNYEVDSYNSNISNFNNSDNHVYQLFDIKELRSKVSPIGR